MRGRARRRRVRSPESAPEAGIRLLLPGLRFAFREMRVEEPDIATIPRRSESTRSVGLSTHRCAVDASAYRTEVVSSSSRFSASAIASGSLRISAALASARYSRRLERLIRSRRAAYGADEAHDREDHDDHASFARAPAVRKRPEPDVGDECDHAREDRRHRHQVRVAVSDVRDLVRDDGLELALRHRAKQPRGDADVARRGAEARSECVRRVVVDEAELRRHGQSGPIETFSTRRRSGRSSSTERLRVRDPGDQAPRADDSEDGIDERNDQCDDAERHVEREPTSPASTTSSSTKPRTTMLRRRFPRICCWRSRCGRESNLRTAVEAPRRELLRVEPERPRDEHPRDALDRRVVVHHRGVVVAPRRADLVLGIREVVLQAQEVLGRLQVGIRLRDGEEAAERGQDVVRLTSSPGRLRVPECRAPSSPPRRPRARALHSP